MREPLAGAGFAVREQGYLLFFPWTGGPWRWLEARLRALPLGAQYVAAEKPRGWGGSPLKARRVAVLRSML